MVLERGAGCASHLGWHNHWGPVASPLLQSSPHKKRNQKRVRDNEDPGTRILSWVSFFQQEQRTFLKLF